ncbi:Enoyl-CoA hydratase/isomerase family [Mycobacteroides abscessus subsp. abscessus]|nr:Enoyl-CoA hydratase/isomerase family [Mycobacteroides abscessus subsp. abscessus]
MPAHCFIPKPIPGMPPGPNPGGTLFDKAWSMVPRRAFGLERRLQLRLIRGANFAIARKAGIDKTEPQFKARSI